MRVSVKWARRRLELELDSAAPTAAFKRALFEVTGVEPERQKIIVKRVGMVKDAPNWDAYQLQAGAALVLMGTPSGKAVRVGLPETWSVLAQGWRTHGLPAGSLTPLQASMVRLAWAGLLQERLGADAASAFVADDGDVFARIGQLVISSAKRIAFGESASEGALHHIATEGGRSAFNHPVDASWLGFYGGLSVAASSGGSEPPPRPHPTPPLLPPPSLFSNFVCQAQGAGCRTGDEPNSWLRVDLGEGRLLAPDRYALQLPPAELQLGRWDMRKINVLPGTVAWELQAATGTDGPWTTLCTHVYAELEMQSPRGALEPDTGIQGRMDAMARAGVHARNVAQPPRPGHWAIEGESPGWRCFRVIQRGSNTALAAGSDRLVCGGLELWGVLEDDSTRGGGANEDSDTEPEPEPEPELEPEPEMQDVPHVEVQEGSPDTEPEPELEGVGSPLANPWHAGRAMQQQRHAEQQARVDAQAEAQARAFFDPDTFDR